MQSVMTRCLAGAEQLTFVEGRPVQFLMSKASRRPSSFACSSALGGHLQTSGGLAVVRMRSICHLPAMFAFMNFARRLGDEIETREASSAVPQKFLEKSTVP